ncbi:MAG: hypothetical protein HGA50_11420 [Deltaproteobacteria bacterium]|nr:hypothetical protein [Deltaproteobacteria bacterium]
MYRIIVSIALILLVSASPAFAKSYLLFLEAQGVGGYSEENDEAIYYSMNPVDVMQKPSVGFDYLQRFSSETGDWGSFALQMRLAYNEAYRATGEEEFQVQIYNAFFKYKAGFADVWVGHNRIAFGLASYLDSHALLLQPLAMYGYGYDRDWGVGMTRDFEWGNLSLSYSTGSGMPLEFDGNYLISGRASYGVLSRDNYNIGVSSTYGKPIDTIGYEKIMPDPMRTFLYGADFTYFWNNIENRFEAVAGEKMEEDTYAFLWRIGVNFLEEDRLKLEFQPVYRNFEGDWNYELNGGITYKLTSDIALRGVYTYDAEMNDNRVVFQIYWYYKLL